MASLHLSEDLKVAIEFMVQKIAILARTGAGKTNTAVVIAEEVLDAKQQVVALDPKGDWWGLRSSADGKSAGYAITVLGGDHGDLPLEPTAGALVAELAAEGVSLVLDLSGFSGADLRRFVTDFAEAFYRAKAKHVSPVLLIIEEADEVVPQRVDAANARMVGAIERIVKRGRFRGIGTLLVTQRSASVNKDVLTQTEILIVQQTTSPQDRKAIDLWVEQHPDQEKRAELMANIASLKKGEAFLWSPTFLEKFVRIRFRLRKTYDAGRDVKIGELRAGPKVLAPVDLAALGAKMKATADRVKADDPKALRQRIRELEVAVKTATKDSKTIPVPAPKIIEKPVLKEAQIKRIEKVVGTLEQMSANVVNVASLFMDAAKDIKAALIGAAAEAPRPVGRPLDSVGKLGTQGLLSAAGPVRATAPAANLNRPSTRPSPRPESVRPRESRVTDAGEAGLTKAHQAVLNAALFLEGVGFRSPGVPQLALTAGLSPTGGYWRQIIGRLRSAGFVEPRGTSLTPAGRAQAVAEPLGGPQDVQARVRAVLPSSTHQAVYDLLLAAYPNGLDQDDERLPKGGYGRQIVGRLRSLGVARKGWPLTAAPFLFLEYDLGQTG